MIFPYIFLCSKDLIMFYAYIFIGAGYRALYRFEETHFQRMGTEIMNLFHSMGLPCVRAEGEGEAMAAALSKCGKVDGVATNDADAYVL